MTDAEEELRLQRDNFMNILEAITDGIYIVNRDCDIEYVNPVIEREFGKVEGRKCYAYFHDRTEPCPWCKNETVFNGGSVRWEWHSEKTGKTYDLFDTPIANPDGTVSKFEIFHDITDHKKLLQALRESEERYRQLFHASKAVELLIDPEKGEIVDANEAACRFYGYSLEAIVAKFIYEINTLTPAEIDTEMEAVKAQKRNYFNFRHRLSSGEVRDVEVYSSPVTVGGKALLHSIVHDITERKRAQEALAASETLFHNYFELGQVGMAITSLDQKWLKVNNRLCEMLGYTKDELTNMTWTELTHPDDLEPDLVQFRRLLSGEIERYAMDKGFFRKSGAVVHTHLTVACQRKPDRSIDYVIASLLDITDRKASEEKLKAAKEEAESATRLKDKFVSLVAHDLKSPISNSILALKNLRARLKEDGVPLADDPMLALSIGANENMLQLIDDLLQMSRIKSGAISPRLAFTDAHYLFQYAADFNSGAAKRKGITIANDVPPRTRLYCDMKLTGEVAVNLISNAIKFCKKGDIITLGQKAGQPSAFFIKDTGVGIPPNRLSSLLKFEEPTSTVGTEGERGTGMGLPLSNELIRSQGGQLQIESAPGTGTTVVISFPQVAPKALVVEDSNFDMQIARMFLKDIGIAAIEAAGGEEGLRLMEKELPHLVLLDINLPDIDGFEILRRKGNNPKIAPIPVIIITGSEDPDIADEAFRLGAADFIKKPLQAETLTARVRRIVS